MAQARAKTHYRPAIAAAALATAFGLGLLLYENAAEEVSSSERPGGQQRSLEHAENRHVPSARTPAATSSLGAGIAAHPEHEHVAEGAHEDNPGVHRGCQHGPGDLKSEAEYERLQRRAADVVASGSAATLNALTNEPDLQVWIAGALLDDLNAFSDLKLAAGLAELTTNTAHPVSLRELAIELLGKSPATTAGTVTLLADLAQDGASAEQTRGIAIGALRLLAHERPDLSDQTRAALLATARMAPTAWLRADALDGVRAQGASPDQHARLIDYLGAQDPDVRNGAARALADSDASQREATRAALRRAFLAETHPVPASTILDSLVRVARVDATRELESLSGAWIVRQTPELAQQITDYRAVLGTGETDPTLVLRARQALVQERFSTPQDSSSALEPK